MRPLSTLTRAQGANRALIDGEVTPAGYQLVFADEPVLVKGFRKMVRGLEYDVAEMALTTYLTAKEHGAAFTALPVFLVRDFHHGATQVRRGGPSSPEDLAGGRVGVNRGYTVTTGVWGRAALAEHGLDLDSVTWVLSGDEHVASYVAPANVVPAPPGRTLEELLLAGELDAVVGAAIDHPDVVPLIADPEAAGIALLEERGIFPVNHLVVVKDELLARHPDLAVSLFEAFAEAKRRYVERLRDGLADTRQDQVLGRVLEITGRDPLPYGVPPNRAVLEELLEHALSQHILTRPVAPEDVFAADTLTLHG
jgi:4,5-dihydroxyphthalate decarboxylase